MGLSFRSFRFTSAGTTGDHSRQQQTVTCDVKMTPDDVPNDQAPACECYSENECAAQRRPFTPGACTSNTDCDNGTNICNENNCESCGNLETAQACQARFNIYNLIYMKHRRCYGFLIEYFLLTLSKNRKFTNAQTFNDCITVCAGDQNQGSALFSL